MNSELPPEQATSSEPGNIARSAKRIHIPNLLGCLVVGFVVLILAGIAMPVFNTMNIRGEETRTLADAKSVGLSLKLFASDHNGIYPVQGVPIEMRDAPADSNHAFACLFGTYVQSEKIFGVKSSAYQTRVPDNVIDNPYTGQPIKTLEPGENAFGYVEGLTDKDRASLPLVVDGTDGTGHYVTDPKKRGGVWKGQKAILIHLDNSGELATLTGSDNARFIPRTRDDPKHNLLDAAYLKDNHSCLLDPAVATRP